MTGLNDTQEQQQQDDEHGKEKHSRRRTGIMTHQPHAMEGVTELGRDGMYYLTRRYVIYIDNMYLRYSRSQSTSYCHQE